MEFTTIPNESLIILQLKFATVTVKWVQDFNESNIYVGFVARRGIPSRAPNWALV